MNELLDKVSGRELLMIIYATLTQPYSDEGKRFKSATAPQL